MPRERSGESPETESARIGPYEIIRELGRGGQGVVYLACDVRLGRRVALKVLSGIGPVSGELLARFRREAEIASKIDHPGICAVHEMGVEKGIPYIAMRYVEGETVAQQIQRAKGFGDRGSLVSFVDSLHSETVRDPDSVATVEREQPTPLPATPTLPLNALLVLFEKLARALHVAHEAGVLHRDIKPGNVMVSPGGEPVIMDFGLARDDSDGVLSLTRTGDVFGTPAYMSPEQVRGDRHALDRRSDVYSLGVMLYECLTLERPFQAATREALYRSILNDEPTLPRSKNRAIPEDLDVVIATVLAKEVDKRYESAEALANDLAAVREHRPISAKHVGIFGRSMRWARRHPARALLLAVLAIGIPTVTALGGFILANLPDIQAQEHQRVVDEVELLLDEGFYRLHLAHVDAAERSFAEAVRKLPGSRAGTIGLVLTDLKRRRAASARQIVLREAAVLGPAIVKVVQVRALELEQRNDEAKELAAEVPLPADDLERFMFAMIELSRADSFRAGMRARAAYGRARDLLEVTVMSTETPRRIYHFELLHALGRLDTDARPEAALRATEILWKNAVQADYWRAFVLLRTDPDAAIRIYERAALRDPRCGAHNDIGNILYKQGRHEEALEHFRKELEHGEFPAVPHTNIGICWLDKNDPEMAVASFRRALEFDASAEAHRLLGVGLVALGHHQEALASHESAVRLDPESAIARRSLSKALFKLGRLQDSIAELERAVALDPEYWDAQHDLYVSYQEAGDLRKAVDTRRRLLARDPNDPEIHGWIGDSLLKLGDSDAGILSLREAVRCAPEEIPWRYLLCRSLERLNREDEALIEYHAAIVQNLKWSWAHNLLGDLIKKRGDLVTATASYRRAIEADANDYRAHHNLAEALLEVGDHDAALMSYEVVLSLKPDFAGSSLGIGKIREARGDRVGAIEAFASALVAVPLAHPIWRDVGLAARRWFDDSDATRAAQLQEKLVELLQRKGAPSSTLDAAKEALAEFRRGVKRGDG